MAKDHGDVVVVTSREVGSLGDYGRILARHLPVPHLELDAGGTSMETFDARPFGVTALLAPLRDAWLVRTLRSSGPGLLHLTHHHMARYGPRTGRRFIVTVHDLIRHTDLTTGGGLISTPSRRDAAGLRRDYAGLHRADHLIAVSEATRRDLIDQLGISPELITVVYEGVDTARFRPSGTRPRTDPYVLYVGSEQPRKNLPALLRAFAEVKRDPELRRLRLVKVGAPQSGDALSGPELRERTRQVVAELRLDDDVVFTGHVPDEELAAYYTHAECLVLPSLYEGFGFPPLEAMACGCPVIVSAAGSLPEVAGDAALLIDPRSVDDLARTLYVVLTDPALRADLRRRGAKRAGAFTWARTAQRTLEVYERVLNRTVQPAG